MDVAEADGAAAIFAGSGGAAAEVDGSGSIGSATFEVVDTVGLAARSEAADPTTARRLMLQLQAMQQEGAELDQRLEANEQAAQEAETVDLRRRRRRKGGGAKAGNA